MAVNFEIPTTEIPVGKGNFTVRGMTSEDVTFLVTNYLADLKEVVARYGESGVVPKNRVAEFCIEVAQHFPLMASEIISRCAESETTEDMKKIHNLPFPKQVQALKEIALLTAEDGADLKKVLGVVASLLEANGLKPGPLTASLQTIIGTSENQSPT